MSRPSWWWSIGNWLRRPERVRDAGLIVVVLGLLNLPGFVLGSWQLGADLLRSPDSYDVGIYYGGILASLLFFGAGLLLQVWLGWQMTAGRLWAVWASLGVRSVTMATEVIAAGRAIAGATALMDLGQMETRDLAFRYTFLLRTVLYELIPLAMCVIALYAYYCNRKSFRARHSSLLTKMGAVLLLALLAATGARRCLNGSERWWPDMQRNGGTVLLYAAEEPSPPGQPYDREDLAVLWRLLDPSGRKGVLVLPAGDSQVEISIPHYCKDHEGVVNLVKDLVGDVAAGPGHLEFLILANDHNDKDALESAEHYFKVAALKDSVPGAELRRELELLASRDEPPPPPTLDGNEVFQTAKGDFRYRWVAVGRSERLALGLAYPRDDKGNPIEDKDEIKKLFDEEKVEHNGVEVRLDPYWFERQGDYDLGASRRATWLRIAEARAKGEPVKMSSGTLLWSRPVAAINPADKRRDKQIDYFFLAREPEEGKQITEQYLVKAVPGLDSQGRLAVHFGLDSTGAELFRQLTSANKPTREWGPKTHMAIVLDGQIMSSPTINGVIGAEGIIEGNFTQVEVHKLQVALLRSRPSRLRLARFPTDERTVIPSWW